MPPDIYPVKCVPLCIYNNKPEGEGCISISIGLLLLLLLLRVTGLALLLSSITAHRCDVSAPRLSGQLTSSTFSLSLFYHQILFDSFCLYMQTTTACDCIDCIDFRKTKQILLPLYTGLKKVRNIID